jgi:hypothetical protein
MTAKQLRYFGKRKKRVYAESVPTKRRSYSMARYRRKGGYSRGSRGGFGGLKGMIFPIAAGAIDHYANGMLPINGVGATVVGMFGKNETLKNIGLYQIGGSIPDLIPGIGGIGGGVKTGGFA